MTSKSGEDGWNYGAEMWVELGGVATLRQSDQGEVFVTSFRFQTGDERYGWLNTTYAILKGVAG